MISNNNTNLNLSYHSPNPCLCIKKFWMCTSSWGDPKRLMGQLNCSATNIIMVLTGISLDNRSARCLADSAPGCTVRLNKHFLKAAGLLLPPLPPPLSLFLWTLSSRLEYNSWTVGYLLLFLLHFWLIIIVLHRKLHLFIWSKHS